MKQVFFSLYLLATINLVACSQSNVSTYNGKKWEQLEGSGNLLTLNPAIGAFNTIEVNNLNVTIRVETGAAEYAMNISIDDNLKDFFKWKQEEGTLKLAFDMSGGKYPRWLSGSNTVVVIKAPAIEKVINKGNSKMEINLKDQDNFTLYSDGNPDINLFGKIVLLNLQSKGNADLNAGELAAEKIILSTYGNADIEVRTKELVEKDVNGNNEIVNLYYTAKKEKQSEDNNWKNEETFLVSFKLKNISALPSKVTVISYRPDVKGNGTNSFMLISLGTKKFSFPVGTKIYLANTDQVNTVMSGAAISDQAPFLVVKKEDEDKIFKIN